MKTNHTLDWNGDEHVVTLSNDSGTIEVTLDEFLALADRLITGLLEPGNSARRKSFEKLTALKSGLRHPGGRA